MNFRGKDERYCKACDSTKHENEFGRQGNNWDHLCRLCRAAYQKEWFAKHSERLLWTKKVKDFVLKKQQDILTLNP